ncbi:sel1 repeat family protein [Donghicola sp. C2-DW-16]|uniref:Sel1 repeat family protein n=1 Tax=Donghicola mangrovi TaxID=2729614 RepID=A0ABX2PB71_9RHOB|nr:sel1 repeat family protein [Donghicola mangrovi]NVO26356.1 sel1 repeat family protein [Donghicola mangrovi]
MTGYLKRFTGAVALSVALCGAAAADQFDDAMAAFKSGDLDRAVVLFQKLAEHNDGAAQANLAVLYAIGQGVPQDDMNAYYWAWRSRFSGEKAAISMIKLLRERLTEEGRAEVAGRLVTDLTATAERGDLGALTALGRVYNEVSEPSQKAEALLWFTVAAAFEAPHAALFREGVSQEITKQERLTIQARARQLFTEWCEKLPENKLPATCKKS